MDAGVGPLDRLRTGVQTVSERMTCVRAVLPHGGEYCHASRLIKYGFTNHTTHPPHCFDARATPTTHPTPTVHTHGAGVCGERSAVMDFRELLDDLPCTKNTCMQKRTPPVRCTERNTQSR
eukprot:scaffold85313_cov67-Phaeocystis_antarctica.AAC.9